MQLARVESRAVGGRGLGRGRRGRGDAGVRRPRGLRGERLGGVGPGQLSSSQSVKAAPGGVRGNWSAVSGIRTWV